MWARSAATSRDVEAEMRDERFRQQLGRSEISDDGVVRLSDGLFDQPLPDVRATVVAAFERRYARRLLAATRGRIGETAKRAGINQRHLYDLMKRHGLSKEKFKQE